MKKELRPLLSPLGRSAGGRFAATRVAVQLLTGRSSLLVGAGGVHSEISLIKDSILWS